MEKQILKMMARMNDQESQEKKEEQAEISNA